RPRIVHGAAHHAVRRTDLLARPGADQGGAGGHGGVGERRHDDDLRHARDGFRPTRCRPLRLHGSGRDRRDRGGRTLFRRAAEHTTAILLVANTPLRIGWPVVPALVERITATFGSISIG